MSTTKIYRTTWAPIHADEDSRYPDPVPPENDNDWLGGIDWTMIGSQVVDSNILWFWESPKPPPPEAFFRDR
jgi:hypothetical protein